MGEVRGEREKVRSERSIIKWIEKIFDIVSTCRNEKRTRQFIKPFGIENSSKFDFFTPKSCIFQKFLVVLRHAPSLTGGFPPKVRSHFRANKQAFWYRKFK